MDGCWRSISFLLVMQLLSSFYNRVAEENVEDQILTVIHIESIRFTLIFDYVDLYDESTSI